MVCILWDNDLIMNYSLHSIESKLDLEKIFCNAIQINWFIIGLLIFKWGKVFLSCSFFCNASVNGNHQYLLWEEWYLDSRSYDYLANKSNDVLWIRLFFWRNFLWFHLIKKTKIDGAWYLDYLFAIWVLGLLVGKCYQPVLVLIG